MKEAFEKIKERLEEVRTTEQFNRGKLLKDNDYAGANIAHRGIVMLNEALSIVSEVEAEYTKNIMDELLEAKRNCGEDSDCTQCIFGCEDGCRLQELQITGGNNGWIPCSERLPDEPKENPFFDGKPLELYLVSMKHDKYPWRAFWNGKDFTDGWSIVQPEAWMPLPEPYQPTTD